MRNKWGRIIFISSLSGRTGQIGQSSYAASKSALVGLSRSLAKEYASRNITVNVVAPGAIKTDMLEKLSDDQITQYIESIPLGRLGEPEEIAELSHFYPLHMLHISQAASSQLMAAFTWDKPCLISLVEVE